MLSGTTHVSAGIAGDTGAPRPTLLNAGAAAGGLAGEHDIAVAATNAASVPDAPFHPVFFDIPRVLSRAIIGRPAVRVETSLTRSAPR